MFSRLHRKIIRHILIPSILFTTIMSVISFYFLSRSLYDNYIYSASKNINQNIKNSLFTIEAAKNSTIQIASNKEIIDSITNNTYDPGINPILNTLKNTSYGILGVTLYTNTDLTYHTNSVTSYPTLNELKQNQLIADFLNSDETLLLSIRTNTIADIYNNVKYNHEYGMISYIVKLYDTDKKILGYLFVDINPSYIYNNFFKYENYKDFKATTYIISQDGDYLKSELNTRSLVSYLDEINDNDKHLSKDFKYLLISQPFVDNTSIKTIVPMSPLYKKLIILGSSIIVTSFILNFIAYLIAKMLADNIISALNQLRRKVNDTNIANE